MRNVTVRLDQTLLISPISVLYWADAVFDTEAKMRADALNVLGVVTNLSVTIDGAPALLPAGFASLSQFRQSSPLFPLTLVAGNVTGYALGVFPAIVEGYLMALQGLPIGNHQLRPRPSAPTRAAASRRTSPTTSPPCPRPVPGS